MFYYHAVALVSSQAKFFSRFDPTPHPWEKLLCCASNHFSMSYPQVIQKKFCEIKLYRVFPSQTSSKPIIDKVEGLHAILIGLHSALLLFSQVASLSNKFLLELAKGKTAYFMLSISNSESLYIRLSYVNLPQKVRQGAFSEQIQSRDSRLLTSFASSFFSGIMGTPNTPDQIPSRRHRPSPPTESTPSNHLTPKTYLPAQQNFPAFLPFRTPRGSSRGLFLSFLGVEFHPHLERSHRVCLWAATKKG